MGMMRRRNRISPRQRILAIRDRVSLLGNPSIIGTVTALSTGTPPRARVGWTGNTTTWVDVTRLVVHQVRART